MNKTINGRVSALRKHKTPQKTTMAHNYPRDYSINRRKMVQTEQRIGYNKLEQNADQGNSNQNVTPIRIKDYEK